MGRRAGRGLAAPLLATAFAVIALGCSGEDGATPATTSAPPATDAATTTTAAPESAGRVADPYVPQAGECFDARTTTEPGTGRERVVTLLLDCGLPHEQEVIAVLEVTEGTTPGPAPVSYPGVESLRRYARRVCPPRFRDHVGETFELSRYGLDYVVPTDAQWPEHRRIACTVTGPDGTRTAGSARDTKQ